MNRIQYVLLVITVLVGCSKKDAKILGPGFFCLNCTGPDSKPDLKPAKYKDCRELQETVRTSYAQAQADYRKRRSETEIVYEDASTAPSGTAQSSAAPGSSSAAGYTNIQEQGVDEADDVKIGKDHIFVAHAGFISIVDRVSLNEIGKLDTDISSPKLYVLGDLLVVLGKSWSSQARFAYEDYYNKTIVLTYKAIPNHIPQLQRRYEWDSSYTDSRLQEGHLVIVMNSYMPIKEGVHIYGDTPIPAEPVIIDDGKLNGIACQQTTKPIDTSTSSDSLYMDMRLNTVASINLNDLTEDAKILATQGSGDQIYMSQKSPYLASRRYNQNYDFNEQLFLTKIKISDSGDIDVAATGVIGGYTKDQWAFKEFAQNETLVVATTATPNRDHYHAEMTNYLWVLQQEGERLAIQNRPDKFDEDEDIRSVRYVNDIAHIVTFKKTDPLFAFDLSNPKHPKLLDELKIPGFSTYMHPAADGRMVGIGFDALDMGDFAWFQGLQVSLFDTSDPKQLERIDNHILGARGSSSEVTRDHHAFFYDSETALMAIPVVELSHSTAEHEPYEYGDRISFSGAIMYQIGANQITEVGRISHADLLPAECTTSNQNPWGGWWSNLNLSFDARRGFKLDGHLISISPFAVRSHDLDSFTVLQTTTLTGVNPCVSNNFAY